MGVDVIFETHSLSEDNERGVATGWLPGRLSERGRFLAGELGDRRRHNGLDAVFTSDLRRAVETTAIAFSGSEVPVFYDWRLRECDYGELNGTLATDLHAARTKHIETRYPGGESWHEAIERVDATLDDIVRGWAGRRILIVGHVSTRWALDVRCRGQSLKDLAALPFEGQEGWEYELTPRARADIRDMSRSA